MELNDLMGAEPRDIFSLQFVSQIKEFVELHDFMKDDDIVEMLDKAIRCIAEPHMRAETASKLLVQFQAASVKFGALAIVYTTIKKGPAGTEENKKKNIYYSMSDLCDKMAGALKYIVRRYES